jgi:UDP-2,3-diacylglucosamine pyrophosphatase LpxH
MADLADLAELEVAIGGRVLVLADLLLEREPTTASSSAAAELVKVIEAWTGPGVLVVAGNLFDLLGITRDPAQALAAHPRLTAALKAFCEEGRRVVVLPGSRDARLAWDAKAAAVVQKELRAEVLPAVELVVHTGAGDRRVRVEPGDRFDPRWARTQPDDAADSPLGLHVVQQVLPAFGQARTTWLQGVERLANDADLPRFVASRLLYRRITRHIWWLVVPFLLAVLLKFPLSFLVSHLGGVPRRAFVVGLTTFIDLVLVAAAVYWVSRRAWSAVSGAVLGSLGQAQNDEARDDARRLVTSGPS